MNNDFEKPLPFDEPLTEAQQKMVNTTVFNTFKRKDLYFDAIYDDSRCSHSVSTSIAKLINDLDMKQLYWTLILKGR
jgi:hypothetical protein